MARNDSFVTVGFSQPYAARYTYDESTGKVTYSDGLKLGRGVSVSLEVETSDGDGFYADNIEAESDAAQVTGGTDTVTFDGLDKEGAALILNTNTVADSATAENDKVYFGAESVTPVPYVGFGYIVKQRFHGTTWYRVHILPKTQFTIPGESAETQADSINWQTQELSADILRSDEAVTQTINGAQVTFNPWKVICGTKYATEAAALARLKEELGI